MAWICPRCRDGKCETQGQCFNPDCGCPCQDDDQGDDA